MKERPGVVMRWFFRAPPAFHAVLRRLGRADVMRGRMLLLTTRGRRTARPRTTALNYATADGTLYVMAGFKRCDWLANLRADPHVEVSLGQERWEGIARIVCDPAERRRALHAARDQAASQGPPDVIKPVLKALGFDYDAEVRKLEDEDAYQDLPTVAIDRVATPVDARAYAAARLPPN